MSEPSSLGNLRFEGSTDPTSQLTQGNPGAVNPGPINSPGGNIGINPGPINSPGGNVGVNPGPSQDKWRLPGTDPVSGQEKIVAPGTDPLSQVALNPQPLPPTNLNPSTLGQEKIVAPGTDPLSKVGLNPQPLPPKNLSPSAMGDLGGRNPGPTGRGVRNTIIVVCVIAFLLIGGGFVLQSAHSGTGGATVTFQPGVAQWQHQIQVSSTAKEHLTTSGSAHCATGSSLGTLEEHLVGGGFTSDDDPGVVLSSESSYPSGNDHWLADFVPQTKGHNATVLAICLREPASFFSGLQSFDTVQSSPADAALDDKHSPAAVATAACPSGEAILGGGYMSVNSGRDAYSVDATYPIYANGVGAWRVAFHINGGERMQLTAYAMCAKGLTTHLEHKALPGIISKTEPYTQGGMGCASGTLLTGGYQITAPPSLVGIGDNSPLDYKTRTPASGAFVQQWYVEAVSSGWQTHVSPGDIWVTCLDTPGSATPATTDTVATTASTATTTQPTSTPQLRATATPISQPTATTVPACQSIVTGGGTMNVDNSYLNVDIAAGIGHTLAGSQAHWDPASGTIVPVNGASLSDQTAIGSNGFSGLTCAQLASASYSASSVSVTNGEVFLVKTPGGHVAKVLIVLAPGSATPALRWETYQP